MLYIKPTNVNYLQNLDFAPDRELIEEAVNEERTVADVVATLLTRYTSHTWSKEAGDRSTRGAKIVYYGKNKRAFPTVPKYDDVLIVELSKEDTIEFAGKKLFFMLGRQ